jgi:hypothetical protein
LRTPMRFSELFVRFWKVSKKSPWREFFSSEWRGSRDVSPPIVTTPSDLK